MDITWNVDVETWTRLVAESPNATFFHTPAWYEANRCLGYEPAAVAFRWPDGTEALLPLALKPSYKGLLKEGFAGIENGYGGLVSARPLSPMQVAAAYQGVRRRYADLRVVGNPFEVYANVPADGERHEDATQVVPVLEPAAQRKRMSDTRVKHCKRGAKAGFTLEVKSGLTGEDAARFYALYASRAADWDYGKWARDEAYFRSLCEVAGRHLVLFLAYQGETLAGFRLLGVTGPVVMDLFLATDPAFEPQHVGPLLVEAPLNWCFEQGYAQFDFQPSGRLEGVKAYKASFGAEPVPHAHVVLRGTAGRSLDALRRLIRPEAA